MLCSTYDFRFHQSPGIVLALTNGRRMGTSILHGKHYYASGGFFTDSDLGNVKNISQGYAIDGRLVYRPVNEEGKLLHIGAAVVFVLRIAHCREMKTRIRLFINLRG